MSINRVCRRTLIRGRGKMCRFCRKLTEKKRRFVALGNSIRERIRRLRESDDGPKDALMKRIEQDGVGAVVSEMVENNWKKDTFSTLREMFGHYEAVNMMIGEDGRASLSELLEIMSPSEARAHLGISEQEDESTEGLSKAEIREQKGISKEEDESLEGLGLGDIEDEE